MKQSPKIDYSTSALWHWSDKQEKAVTVWDNTQSKPFTDSLNKRKIIELENYLQSLKYFEHD